MDKRDLTEQEIRTRTIDSVAPRPTIRDLHGGVVQVLDDAGNTMGASFVLTEDGLLVTCAHVVEAEHARPGQALHVAFHSDFQGTADVEEEGWCRS